MNNLTLDLPESARLHGSHCAAVFDNISPELGYGVDLRRGGRVVPAARRIRVRPERDRRCLAGA